MYPDHHTLIILLPALASLSSFVPASVPLHLVLLPLTLSPFLRFLVRVSYLEIYNEEVRDLLRQDQSVRLEVKERPDVGVYVKDLLTHVVHNAGEMDRIMTLGNKNSKWACGDCGGDGGVCGIVESGK